MSEIVGKNITVKKRPVFRPQPGFQEQLLLTDRVNFVIAGSGAGVGKTFISLMDAARYTTVKGYYAAMFRRTFQQIFTSIAPQADKVFGGIRYSKFIKSPHPQWIFYDDPKRRIERSKIQFMQMLYESDKLKIQGAELSRAYVDECSHFSSSQIFYIFSRLRSQTSVTPRLLGTCNPDPNSFLLDLLDSGGYLLSDGFADPSMAGKSQWMVHIDGEYFFAPIDQKQELWDKTKIEPMSFCFLPGSIRDNKIMLSQNSQYLSLLEGLPEVEKMMLLHGCWKASNNKGLIKSHVIKTFFEDDLGAPIPIVSKAIFCDTSYKASEKNDWNVFLAAGLSADGKLYVLDVLRFKTENPMELFDRAFHFYKKHEKRDYSIMNFETGKKVFFRPFSFQGIFIEDYGRGTDLLYRLKTEKGLQVGPIRRAGDIGKLKKTDYGNRGNDKVSRLVSVLPIIDRCGIHLPAGENRWTGNDGWCDPSVRTNPKKWIPEFKAEILAFGVDENGKISVSNDDQTDCLTDAVTYLAAGTQSARWVSQMLSMGRDIGS